MLLSAHEIVPSLVALEEIYSRPSSDVRTASQNAKIASVLRRKIVASLSRLGNDQQVLHALRYSIHNTSLMYAFGLDVEDFKTLSLYKRYRELTTEQELIRAFNKLKTSGTDTPFMDVIFEGTGIDNPQERETQLKALLKITLENTYNIQYAVATVVKARISKGMDSSRARSIGGIDVGDFVINKVMDALVGREDDSDDPLSSLTKTRGPKTNSLFYKFFRRAEKRKTFLKVLEDNPENAGKGKLSWRNKKQTIISEMRNTSRVLLDLVSQAISEDSSASLGEEAQDAVMEAVTQSYADVLDTLKQESESKNDTDEARENLSDARKAYKADISDSDAKEEYAQAILDVIGSKTVSLDDLRFLLENPEALSSTPATQEAVRNVVYEQLFLRGALTSEELTYLDGGFDEKDLQRRARKEIKKVKMRVESALGKLDNNSTVDDVYYGYDDIKNIIVLLQNSIKQASAIEQEGQKILTSLNNASSLTASKSLLKKDYFDAILAEIYGYLDKYEETLSSEDVAELQGVITDIEKEVDELRETTELYIISPDLVGDKIVGKHPLSKFSIDAYPGTFSTSSDAVEPVGGLSPKKDFAKGLTALDLQVAKKVDDMVKSDPALAEEIEAKTEQIRSLARLREATLLLNARTKYVEADDLGKVDALLTASAPSELADKVNELFESVEGGLTYKERTSQAKALSEEVQKAIEGLKADLKSSYSRIGVVSSLMREAVAEVVSDPRKREGRKEYPHNVYSQRTKKNLLKNTGWSDFVEGVRDEIRGEGNETLTPLKEVQSVAEKAGLDLFQEVLKDRGLESKIEVKRKNIKSSKLTNRQIRSIMTELGKRLLASNPLIEKSKQITESALTKKVVDLTKKIKDDLYKKIEDDLSEKLNQLKENEDDVILDLSGGLTEDARKSKELFGSAFGSFISLARTGKVHKLSDSRKALISLGVDGNDLQALEDHIIMGNLYNFEDRIKDSIAKEIETKVERKEIEKAAREEELRAKGELDEAEKEELAQIETDTDERSATIRRLRAQKKDRVSSELGEARESRNVGSKINYAPAVEGKEAKIIESYNAVIGSAVDALLNVEESMVMEGNNEKSVGKAISDLSVLQRSKAIRTFSALKNKYPAESNTFSPILRNSDETTIEGLLGIYNKYSSSFPSLSASLGGSNEEKQLLFSFLSSPYHVNTLVRSTGDSYALSKNVFSELAYSEHIKSFVRNLVAACRKDVIKKRDGDFKDFYKQYYRNKANLRVLATRYEEEGEDSLLNVSLLDAIGEIHLGLSAPELVEYLNVGAEGQATMMISNPTAQTLQYVPYRNLLNNYKSLLADLNVLMFLAADTIEESVIESYGIDPELVDKMRDLFGAEPVDIQKLITEQS